MSSVNSSCRTPRAFLRIISSSSGFVIMRPLREVCAVSTRVNKDNNHHHVDARGHMCVVLWLGNICLQFRQRKWSPFTAIPILQSISWKLLLCSVCLPMYPATVWACSSKTMTQQDQWWSCKSTLFLVSQRIVMPVASFPASRSL